MKKIPANLPNSSGVYLMKKKDKALYVGKAGSIVRRIKNHFNSTEPKTKKLINETDKISYFKTETVIEALILEARLIKELKPFYNVKDKDDKSFLYLVITKDDFPRVLLVRGKDIKKADYKNVFGPFVCSTSLYQALRIVRKIFPFSVHDPGKKFSKPCFDYQIGLCPGTCVNRADKKEYLKNIKNIERFFEGQKKNIIKSLEKRMAVLSRKLCFEKAETVKRQINALRHIQDISLVTAGEKFSHKLKERWEGYDVSNISGFFATGAMAVFENAKPNKSAYRKFKIRTVRQSDDTGMLKEMLYRRLQNTWPLPCLILVDGGKGQVNAVQSVLNDFGLKINVIGVAKGAKRKKNEFIGQLPEKTDKKDLLYLRDEAHRFAVQYHKKLRSELF